MASQDSLALSSPRGGDWDGRGESDRKRLIERIQGCRCGRGCRSYSCELWLWRWKTGFGWSDKLGVRCRCRYRQVYYLVMRELTNRSSRGYGAGSRQAVYHIDYPRGHLKGPPDRWWTRIGRAPGHARRHPRL